MFLRVNGKGGVERGRMQGNCATCLSRSRWKRVFCCFFDVQNEVEG